MLLLPFDKTNYTTKLSVEEVNERLSEAISDEDEQINKQKDYIGKISGNKFHLYHWKANSRNGIAYTSIVNGNIKSNHGGLTIETSSRMTMIQLVFSTVVLALFAYGLVTAKSFTFNGQEVEEHIWLHKIGIFAFVYLFFLIPYKISYYRNRRFLAQLLDAKSYKTME